MWEFENFFAIVFLVILIFALLGAVDFILESVFLFTKAFRRWRARMRK